MEEEEALMLAALSESPRYMSLLEKLREVDTELAAQSTRFTEDNPTIKKLYQERRNLLPLVAEEAKAVLGNQLEAVPFDLTNLASPNTIRLELLSELLKTETMIREQQGRQRELIRTESEIRQETDKLAQVTREYVDLTRKLEIANKNLTSYLATQQELELEIAKAIYPWRLVSEIRVPEEPISSPLKTSILGIFAGLMLGIGAGLLREQLTETFHSASELQEEMRLPLLGTIPKQAHDLRDNKIKSFENDPDFAIFLEAFFFFHTNLALINQEEPVRSVTITSAIPGEGKSTIAAYLAETAAKIGQKVLLVDGDLRLPQLQNHPGLAPSNTYTHSLEDVLNGNIEADKAIKPSQLHENLDVLAGNSRCRKPSALLGTEKFANLIKQWEEKYDLVIVDSPPLIGLSDTKLIATKTEGLMLVVHLDQTTKDLVQDALGEITSARLPLLGLVANGAKRDTMKTNRYYQQYQRYYQQ
jgi:succinoglycan biosynthesis transport protein ExoP